MFDAKHIAFFPLLSASDQRAPLAETARLRSWPLARYGVDDTNAPGLARESEGNV